MSCQGYAPFLVSADQDRVLDRLLAAAGPGRPAVLDLDGCLFDNRWRQLQILPEYAAHRDLPAIAAVGIEHFRDWSLSRTLREAGVDPALVEEVRADLRTFWGKRFFQGAYVGFDHPMPGAVRLVRGLAAAGAPIVYLTGRDRRMHGGTQRALGRFGFPVEEDGALLLTKPLHGMVDEDWKATALPRIAAMGSPSVFLDNEPVNGNLFREAFPAALVVFVSTDHSPRPARPHPEIPWIRGFLRSSDPNPRASEQR